MGLKQEDVAYLLLYSIWRSIEEEYKMQYPREIWDQFENAVRSASYTDNLKVFLSNFQKRIPTSINAQYSKDIVRVVDCGEDETILNWLRSETTYLIMLVRLRNQDRKTEFELQKIEGE